jgi:exopolyphosphatase / guanosine-5'-triphosphate,3'-diphosphate pyrophosphatase
MRDGTLLAAVDLGSNSFRLEIGRYEHGQVLRMEYLKETVRQGGGLDDARRLDAPAMQRGWECLARFAERLAGFSRAQVRAVATQTLREARNRDEFLGPAQRILGFPIDVISGQEEARLIYQGVAHLLPDSLERRLVVDIGGRSTELIVGSRLDAQVMESCPVGSVDWSMKYFPAGRFTLAGFVQAEIGAKAVLEETANRFRRDAWDVAYGASGTIGAVGDILAGAGWAPGEISAAGLQWLREQLCAARSADRVRLDGLKDDRRPVIGGGLCVLRAVFDLLHVQEMHVALGALRHGVLYDLIEREHGGPDVRSASVQRLARKFAADPEQSARVTQLALALLRELRGGEAADDEERQLAWAAQLHEIGSHIAHESYHKHGAYILDNADVLGFTQPELHRLSLLVLGHRGKLRKLDADLHDAQIAQQLLCLRLAALFCHARRDADTAGVTLRRTRKGFALELPAGWTRAWPQSAHLLREEAQAWQKTPWTFEVRAGDEAEAASPEP